MTKAAKARRRRAERAELQELRMFKLRLQHGGVSAKLWTLNEADHARLEMAAQLDATIVMRRTFNEREWKVFAVKP